MSLVDTWIEIFDLKNAQKGDTFHCFVDGEMTQSTHDEDPEIYAWGMAGYLCSQSNKINSVHSVWLGIQPKGGWNKWSEYMNREENIKLRSELLVNSYTPEEAWNSVSLFLQYLYNSGLSVRFYGDNTTWDFVLADKSIKQYVNENPNTFLTKSGRMINPININSMLNAYQDKRDRKNDKSLIDTACRVHNIILKNEHTHNPGDDAAHMAEFYKYACSNMILQFVDIKQ